MFIYNSSRDFIRGHHYCEFCLAYSFHQVYIFLSLYVFFTSNTGSVFLKMTIQFQQYKLLKFKTEFVNILDL